LTLIETLLSARNRGASLICIRTADQMATIKAVGDSFEESRQPSMIIWNVVQGAYGRDKASGEVLTKALGEAEMAQASTTNLTEFLDMARKFIPRMTMIFVNNLHMFINDPGVRQAIANLRDAFGKNTRTFVGLAPAITLPPELAQDVLMLDEPLPSDADIVRIANRTFEDGGVALPGPVEMEHIVDATLGLAAYPAAQSMAMSLSKDGMRLDELWNRKRGFIEATPGLSVWRGGETFADIGGCENVKRFLSGVVNGDEPPRAVVFIDEIEKSIGTGSDTSGVSQGMLGALLTWMQDSNATGIIFIGPPGAAKSAVAKAFGAEASIPTISLDLGGMKASLVGESESRLRDGLKVIDSVSQGRAIFIATCNSIGTLPPELRRRFTFGTFFFELPDKAERAAIWKIYRNKYGTPASQEIPNDEQWTGAEIKQCCLLARRLKRTLVECAEFIVPVAKSAAAQISQLREQADGKFISASHPGVYRKNREPEAQLESRRAINLEEEKS
jgi:adenylate kinase family enzyme